MIKCKDKEWYSICQKSNLCHLCDGERLFTKPKWMIIKEKQEAKKTAGIKKQKKQGMSFEKKVEKKYNKALNKNSTKKSAKRTIGSGAIWSIPGDIVTENELIECKERGSRTASGAKTISIPKDHLDKVKEEAFLAKRNIWYYIYSYKGSDDIYLIKDYEDELAMIGQIKILKERILELEESCDNI